VNAKDDEGKSPLDWAGMYRENPEMSRLLESFATLERQSK
jgi:ankyrin repeat protein